jgi:hypothetical protein
MKRSILGATIGAVLLLSFGSLTAFAEPTGDKVQIKGEVIDLWCFLEGGDHGADHKECAVACAKAGNPIGLLTEKGDLYVMMGMKDHQPGREILIDRMADTVTVEGTLVKKGGVQVIYVSSVK